MARPMPIISIELSTSSGSGKWVRLPCGDRVLSSIFHSRCPLPRSSPYSDLEPDQRLAVLNCPSFENFPCLYILSILQRIQAALVTNSCQSHLYSSLMSALWSKVDNCTHKNRSAPSTSANSSSIGSSFQGGKRWPCSLALCKSMICSFLDNSREDRGPLGPDLEMVFIFESPMPSHGPKRLIQPLALSSVKDFSACLTSSAFFSTFEKFVLRRSFSAPSFTSSDALK